jgi:hypothetical protein
MQGEEGIKGIAQEGNTYQLISLDVSEKRIPRVRLSPEDWTAVLRQYHYGCAVCHRKEPEVQFEQDHKIPRLRGGGDGQLGNWQPLCNECNNFKSTACRGCLLDCVSCPWAFPERNAPLRILPVIAQGVREMASNYDVDPSDLANEILKKGLG